MTRRETYIAGRDVMPRVSLGQGDSLAMTVLVLPGADCDCAIGVDIDGEGAELDIRGLYLCGGSQRVNINVTVNHNAGRSRSNQLFKGIVGGQAKASFSGLVHVRQDSQKTKAYQANHSLLLTDTATADSRPQLEIYADDVECSHGATVGRLNGDELFYMRSRGIPEDEAKYLQMLSFVSPVMEGLDARTRKMALDALASL